MTNVDFQSENEPLTVRGRGNGGAESMGAKPR